MDVELSCDEEVRWLWVYSRKYLKPRRADRVGGADNAGLEDEGDEAEGVE